MALASYLVNVLPLINNDLYEIVFMSWLKTECRVDKYMLFSKKCLSGPRLRAISKSTSDMLLLIAHFIGASNQYILT